MPTSESADSLEPYSSNVVFGDAQFGHSYGDVSPPVGIEIIILPLLNQLKPFVSNSLLAY